MGLMVLGFFAVYLAASVWVVKAASGWAKANNKRPWLWGSLAAFVMYNLVFWDWIPTQIAHKYYCSTQAGFWVYKTPEQWVKENPELTKEDLRLLGDAKNLLQNFHSLKPLRSNPSKEVLMINERIYLNNDYDYDYDKNIINFLPIHKMSNFTQI